MNSYDMAGSNYWHMEIHSDSTSAINYPNKPLGRRPRTGMYETDPTDGRTNDSAGGAGASCNINAIHSCISRCFSTSGACKLNNQLTTSILVNGSFRASFCLLSVSSVRCARRSRVSTGIG
jgi:hypothetical protein